MSDNTLSETKSQIGFQQIGLGGILKQYRLIVPANQREYAWTDPYVARLLKDFAKVVSDGEPEYFLGTIVTIPQSPDTLEVVDGQQRLATTAILLSQIRNYLKQSEPLIAESITNGFLTDIDRGKRERVAKMRMNVDDNDFFISVIADNEPSPTPSRPSHRLITKAAETSLNQVKNIVSGLDVQDHGDALNKWIEFIEHKAVVILLKVPSDANAYKMFETLNDRGLRTSQADLIKNYVFGQAGPRLPEAQQKWAMMRGALESIDEDRITVTFLKHALIVLNGYVNETNVYETVQRNAKGSAGTIKFLSNLETLANLYVAILNPVSEYWNKYPDAIRKAVKTLDLINIQNLRPLMMAVALKFTEKEANLAFSTIISWGVRILIASRTTTSSLETPLAASATKIYSGDITNLKGLKASMARAIPNDEQFKQEFEIASVSKESLARYYLRSLEMAAKHEPSPWYIPNDDSGTITLEHVLPRNPLQNWPHFSEEAVRTYSKRLGNLALLVAKSNSDLKSANFALKKTIFQQSPYITTRMLATVDEWNEGEITERQKKLAEYALTAWPL